MNMNNQNQKNKSMAFEYSIGEKVKIDFSRDLRMRREWKKYNNEDVFKILRINKMGMYILMDRKGKETLPIAKFRLIKIIG